MHIGTRPPRCEFQSWSSFLVPWTSRLGASLAKAVASSIAPRGKCVHLFPRGLQHEANIVVIRNPSGVLSNNYWQPEGSPIWIEPPANPLSPSAPGRAGCSSILYNRQRCSRSGLGSIPGFQSWSGCQGGSVPGTRIHLLLIFCKQPLASQTSFCL